MKFKEVSSVVRDNPRAHYRNVVFLEFEPENEMEKALLTSLRSAKKTVYSGATYLTVKFENR